MTIKEYILCEVNFISTFTLGKKDKQAQKKESIKKELLKINQKIFLGFEDNIILRQ